MYMQREGLFLHPIIKWGASSVRSESEVGIGLNERKGPAQWEKGKRGRDGKTSGVENVVLS
jgi:hypothetical protein